MSIRERKRRYREKHKAKIAAYAKLWREKNAEYRAQYSKQWRANNREKMARKEKRYRERHREAIMTARNLGIPVPEARMLLNDRILQRLHKFQATLFGDAVDDVLDRLACHCGAPVAGIYYVPQSASVQALCREHDTGSEPIIPLVRRS